MDMKPHWYRILLALVGGARHGAEIRRRIRSMAGEDTEIYPAMLYGSLEDLQEVGYIKEVERPGQHERHRFYRRVQRVVQRG